jgi:glycosyltransferase involved in cell wall biosynthesis
VALALGHLNIAVDVFSRLDDSDAPDIEWFGERSRVIRIAAGPAGYLHRDELVAHMAEFAAGVTRFISTGRASYQGVHTHYWHSGWTGLRVAAELGLPHYHTSHSLALTKYEEPAQELPPSALTRFETERSIIGGCDCVVATCPQEERELREYVPDARIQVVPGGFNKAHFRPQPQAQSRAALGLAASDRIVLYVGRFDQRKGLRALVRSVALLHRDDTTRVVAPRLVVVGDRRAGGADSAEYESVVDEIARLRLGAAVELVGRVPHDRLGSYYSASDVVAVPSYYEPFGLVPLEAMACGRPVVASAVGGLQHTITSGDNGLLVPPRDAQALAIAIGRLLADDRLRAAMSERAAARVRDRFTWPRVAEQLVALYEGHRMPWSRPQAAYAGLRDG